MARRRLFIEQPRTNQQRTPASLCVDVSDTMPIGPLISTLADRFGYPLVDSFGSPVLYRLRPVAGGKPLPTTGRFALAHFRSGSCFVLEAEIVNHQTMPLGYPAGVPAKPSSLPGVSRRAFLTVSGPLVLSSLIGLSAGITTAAAQHILSRQATTVSSTKGGPEIPERLQLSTRLVFARHQQTVRAVAWSPDGTLLASGGDDALAFIWQSDGTALHALQFSSSVCGLAWSPDGEQLAAGAGLSVSFFDAHSAGLLGENTRLHTAPVTALGWTQTGVPLAISASEDTKAAVWNGQTHQAQVIFRQHTAPILALTTLSETVATASLGGVIRVWNALDGQEVHGYFSDTNQALRSVSFSSTGHLASGGDDGVVRLWSDGRVCARQANDSFGLHCLDVPQHLQGHTRSICATAFSPDGTLLATGGEDKKLIIWSMLHAAPVLIQPLPETLTALSWAPCGQFLAGAVGPHVDIWQIQLQERT